MSSSKIILEQYLLGPMDNYVYVIGCAQTKEVGIVDPGWDVDFLQQQAKKSGYKIVAILLTHGHMDHVEGLDQLLRTYDVPVYLSAREAEFYKPECKNLKLTADREVIPIGKITVECLQTPGHTPGCQCYRAEDILLTGDVLFIDGCGRCDLPGGNPKAMYESLYHTILKLPDTVVVYPGHDYGDKPSATLGELRQSNPYLKAKNQEDFFSTRLGLGF